MRSQEETLRKPSLSKKEFGFQKAYGSYAELLDDEDVEAVYIPLPNGLHKEWVLAALQKKKHVLCEKPLALNAADAREMYKAAEENGVILMEAYAYLHSPYVESLKRDIASGIIGDVVYVDSTFMTQGYKEDIRLYHEQGGGAMYDLGCYCSTMILSLVDSKPVFVKADAEFSELDVDLMTAAIIRFENGVRAVLHVGMILGKDTNARYDNLYVYGTKGSIRSSVEFNQEGKLRYTIFADGKEIERKVKAPQNYSLEVAQLGRCILSGEKPHVSPEFSIQNAELMERVFDEIGYYETEK